MKKVIYIASTVVLGFFLSMLIHVGIEILALKFIVPTTSWSTWTGVHRIVSILLALTGVAGGIYIGIYWTRHYKYWSYLGFKNKKYK